jgi:hypothetical protein
MNLSRHILIMLLRAYRTCVSPLLTAIFGPLGFGCRFQPTCSQYALDAVRTHGALNGTALTIRRLCRCHPWGGSGEDPVPPKVVTNVPAHLNCSRHGS